MSPPTLPRDVLVSIFTIAHQPWLDPPWFVQHDVEHMDAQAELASHASVCRAWRQAAQDVLVMRPALRLTWYNIRSFLELVGRLRGRDYDRPRKPVHSALLICDSAAPLDQLCLHMAVRSVRRATMPRGGLYIDNLPGSCLFCLDEWALTLDMEPLESFGVRCVDVGVEPTRFFEGHQNSSWKREGSDAPPRLILPPLPGLRRLHLCGVECSGLFVEAEAAGSEAAGAEALDLSELRELSLNLCAFSLPAGRALRRATKVRHLFLANIAFYPALIEAVFAGWPEPGTDVGVLDLPLPSSTDDPFVLRAWSEPNWPRDDRMPLPPLLAQRRPSRFFGARNATFSAETMRVPRRSDQAASMRDRYLAVCTIWSLHPLRPSLKADLAASLGFCPPPFFSQHAYLVDPQRVAALRIELGYAPPEWTSNSNTLSVQNDFHELFGGWNRALPVNIAFSAHLSRMASVPVQVATCGPQYHEWGEAYICWQPQPFLGAAPIPEGTTTPPEVGLRRVLRRLQPLSGPMRVVVASTVSG